MDSTGLKRKRTDHLRRKAANPELFLEKAREACTRWRNKNPLYLREAHARNRFGVSADELVIHAEKMVIEQNNKCAVCGVVGEVIGLISIRNKIRLVVDHDHKTNKLRGLLCDPCNRALGAIKENKETLKSLIAYIEKWGDKS